MSYSESSSSRFQPGEGHSRGPSSWLRTFVWTFDSSSITQSRPIFWHNKYESSDCGDNGQLDSWRESRSSALRYDCHSWHVTRDHCCHTLLIRHIIMHYCVTQLSGWTMHDVWNLFNLKLCKVNDQWRNVKSIMAWLLWSSLQHICVLKKITRNNEWDTKDIKMVVGTHNTQSGPRP